MRSQQAAPPDAAIFRGFTGLAECLPWLPLSNGPSPVFRLDGLKRWLPADVWVKNDGRYGTLYGGNKARKLEFVLADALRGGAKTVTTTGALATNHGLATALYGSQVGLRVALLLTYEQPAPETGTRLCELLDAGAELHYTGSLPRTAVSAPFYVAKYWRRDGRKPYILGPGGSSSLGTLGYVNAAFELAEQVRAGDLPEPGSILVPAGTGGTAAGLLAGLRLAGLDSQVVAVVVTRAPTAWRIRIQNLARSSARLLARLSGIPQAGTVKLDALTVQRGWLHPGFGRPSPAGEEARALAAAYDLSLDSTYTAKTFAALLALVAARRLPSPVLYWHTYDALSLAPRPRSREDYLRLPSAFHRFCPL